MSASSGGPVRIQPPILTAPGAKCSLSLRQWQEQKRRLKKPPLSPSLYGLLLAGIHPAVVEFCHGAGLTAKAVARRIVLRGVAVSRVRTARVVLRSLVIRSARVIARSAIVRSGSDSGSRADHGGTCDTSAVHSPPGLSPRNTRNAQGRQRATDPCLGTLD